MNLREILEDGGFEPFSYSGRGMFGKQCVGIKTSDSEPFEQAICILMSAADMFKNRKEFLDFCELLKKNRTDSLGRGVVIYWPSVPWDL